MSTYVRVRLTGDHWDAYYQHLGFHVGAYVKAIEGPSGRWTALEAPNGEPHEAFIDGREKAPYGGVCVGAWVDELHGPGSAKASDARPRIFEEAVRRTLAEIGDMLIAKNAAYGDSALNPIRVFSRADAGEQIRVRLDDKLSRLMRGDAAGEDVLLDLVGYVVLLLIHERSKGAAA